MCDRRRKKHCTKGAPRAPLGTPGGAVDTPRGPLGPLGPPWAPGLGWGTTFQTLGCRQDLGPLAPQGAFGDHWTPCCGSPERQVESCKVFSVACCLCLSDPAFGRNTVAAPVKINPSPEGSQQGPPWVPWGPAPYGAPGAQQPS